MFCELFFLLTPAVTAPALHAGVPTVTTTTSATTAAASIPSHGPNTIVGNSWAQPRLVEIHRKEGEHLGISIVGKDLEEIVEIIDLEASILSPWLANFVVRSFKILID